MKLQEKKAEIDLTGLAIGIVILGIAVSIGAIIVHNMGTSQITNAQTYIVANETVTLSTTGTALAKQWVKGIDSVMNASGTNMLNSGNYTLTINSDNGVGTFANTTGAVSYGTALKVSYNVYNQSDPRFAVPASAEVGLAEYGNWFKILVIVGIAGVILALLFMAFGKGNSGSGGVGTTY